MADTKKYYFLKLKDDFFDSEKVKVLESMPNGIYYSNLLIKLYLKALRYDGALKLNESMAYDEKMISVLTGLDIRFVKTGLAALTSLGFLERLEDGTIYMSDMHSLVGKANSESDRKRIYRNKINNRDILDKISPQFLTKPGTKEGTSSDKCPLENREIENIDLELRNIEREDISSVSVSLLKDFEARTGAVGSLNLAALKNAVELHGLDNVKMAMDKALEKNKPTMTYIGGILKNWSVEGYPKEGEKVGYGSFSKNNGAGSNQFTGFKPKEPRSLSEGERETLNGELL